MFSQDASQNSIDFDVGMGDDLPQDLNPMPVDLNHDGTNESVIQGFDTDGDGQPDTWVIASDLNLDGTVDRTSVIQQIDTNADDIPDTWVIQSDTNLDNIPESEAIVQDLDGDGTPDTLVSQAIGASSDVVGEPGEDTAYWHQQAHEDTCAVVSQEFILDELTGQDFTEEQLRQEAYENGWYNPGSGTPMECMGNLLEAHGIDVERRSGCTLDDLSEQLAQGQHVIVGLDAEEVWNPGIDDDDLLCEFVGMPEQGANHAVQVIGIDYSDPDNPMVILNDPGSGNGQGLMVPADQFVDAWEDSGNYMVHTTGQPVQADQLPEMPQVAVGGYYNADESYHWTSYDVDTASDS
jgi:hypothetical protein